MDALRVRHTQAGDFKSTWTLLAMLYFCCVVGLGTQLAATAFVFKHSLHAAAVKYLESKVR